MLFRSDYLSNVGSDTLRLADSFQSSIDPENCPDTICIQSQLIIPPETNHLGVVIPGSVARVISVNNDPPLTRQADHDRACIHCILDLAKKSGHLPTNDAQPLEGDITAPEDYMDAMNFVASVDSQFSTLPVETRERFGHNPANFLRFASNEKNHSELVEMGLARPLETPQTPPATGVTAPTTQVETVAGEA